MQNTWIIDHSPRWQLGYCKSTSAMHSGKYHLMITDKVRLFTPELSPLISTATKTVGYYGKRDIASIVAFLLDQTSNTLESIWRSGT